MHTHTTSRGARPIQGSKHKRTFRIRCLSPDLGVEEKTLSYPAGSYEQALFLASVDKQNARYTDFGLLNADNQIHRWKYRYGEPRVKYQQRTAVLREQLEELFTKPEPKKEQPVAAPAPKPEPERLDSMSPSLMAKVLIEHSIPHVKPGVEFMARDLVQYAPEQYRHLMVKHHLSFAMEKLTSAGIVKREGRVRYSLDPAFVAPSKPIVAEATAPEPIAEPVPVAAAPEVPAPVVVAPAPTPAVVEPPPRPSFDPGNLPVNARADLFFRMADVLLLNGSARDQKIDALGKRLMDTLEALESIRTELAVVMRERADTREFVSALASQWSSAGPEAVSVGTA
jgi:hypothetical protein